MRVRLLFLVAVTLVHLVVALVLDGLAFEPRRDETHFWPTVLEFAREPLPSVELLRDYRGALNTPLPFVIFGQVERLGPGGIQACRAFNLVVSWAVCALIVLATRGPPMRAGLCAIGLLLFPYWLGVAAHVYTDTIPAALVVLGIWLHVRQQFVLAAVVFVLAVASRQPMVAFPVACAVWALWSTRQGGCRPRRAWILPLAAAATLGGWFLFFGGLGPPTELAAQGLSTADPLRFFPEYGLYSLACIGAFWLLPERLLLLRRARPLQWTVLGVLVAALALLVAFVLFPPLGNIDYGVETMGFLDRAARFVTGERDTLRVAFFFCLALLAVLRFARPSLGAAIVWLNALVLTKAHLAWDKYALAAAAVLWFLEADRPPPEPEPEREVSTST